MQTLTIPMTKNRGVRPSPALKTQAEQFLRLGLLLCLCLFMSACSMSFISDYDQASMNEMQLVNKKIDRFFITMTYADPADRGYEKFKAAYLDIDVELNALRTMQSVRPMNELTVKQVDILLNLWKQERAGHQKSNGLSNFIIKLHRSQYNRLLMAMIKGESAKPKEPKSK
jgi:hypothetical protein